MHSETAAYVSRLTDTCVDTFVQISDYEKEIEIMQSVTKEEYLASLRR